MYICTYLYADICLKFFRCSPKPLKRPSNHQKVWKSSYFYPFSSVRDSPFRYLRVTISMYYSNTSDWSPGIFGNMKLRLQITHRIITAVPQLPTPFSYQSFSPFSFLWIQPFKRKPRISFFMVTKHCSVLTEFMISINSNKLCFSHKKHFLNIEK